MYVCDHRTEPVTFTKQEFEEVVVRRYLPHGRLSSGLLVVDESTYETIRQKLVKDDVTFCCLMLVHLVQ